MELKETPAVEDQSLLTSQPTVHIIKSTSKDGRQGKKGIEGKNKTFFVWIWNEEKIFRRQAWNFIFEPTYYFFFEC